MGTRCLAVVLALIFAACTRRATGPSALSPLQPEAEVQTSRRSFSARLALTGSSSVKNPETTLVSTKRLFICGHPARHGALDRFTDHLEIFRMGPRLHRALQVQNVSSAVAYKHKRAMTTSEVQGQTPEFDSTSQFALTESGVRPDAPRGSKPSCSHGLAASVKWP